MDLKERADRALRAKRPGDALPLYGALLGIVHETAGIYDSWLEGALGAYQALGRRFEAGQVLLGLRRFGDAQRHFSVGERPLEWALCASKLGRHAESARVLAAAGHPVLAAVELETAGETAAARAEWERALRDPRLAGRAYETALLHFSLAECLLCLGELEPALREMAVAQRMIEVLADDFESRGESERALDCYCLLLRMGKDTGSFENVAEGYLNAIRIQAKNDQRFMVMQYYDDFLAYAVERGEWYAAATLAREAADFSAKTALVYDRHYLARAAALWSETARQNEAAGGPTDLSENALSAGIDAATTLGDLALVSRLYGELAALPLPVAKRERYQTLGARYGTAGPPIAPTVGFSEYLRNPTAYHEVWRQDLIEWELDGDPAAVLTRLVVDRTDHLRPPRLALRALLMVSTLGSALDRTNAMAELAVALGRIPTYEVLRPMEKLYEQSQSPEVRAAVMTGVGQITIRRSFGLVRRGREDPAARVREEALGALRRLNFRDALDPLLRIFRDKTDERIRLAALETIADIGSLEAAMVLLDAVLYETGAVQTRAELRLRAFNRDELGPNLRRILDSADTDASAFRRALAAVDGPQ